MNNYSSLDAIAKVQFSAEMLQEHQQSLLEVCNQLKQSVAAVVNQISTLEVGVPQTIASQILSPAIEQVVSSYTTLDLANFSLLSNRLLDALQVIDWDKTRALSEAINDSISSTVLQTLESVSTNDDRDLEDYLKVFESVEPYMPEEVNAEIKQKIVEPLAKTEKVTIDTKLSIVSIVLTILIFLYGQVVDHKKEEQNQKLIASLAQTIQQLSDEVSELSDQLEQSKELLSKAEDTQCDTDQRDCLHETEAVDPT